MRLVLVGPPGSGKGTQAKLLVERLGLTYVGTGEILRDAIRAGTPTGQLAEPLLKQGLLVPDDVVNRVVEELFCQASAPQKFVLDGYPRTHAQAVWFDKLLSRLKLKLDAVLHFAVSDEEVVRRMSSRGRDDDNEATVRRRLVEYHKNTDALIEHYRKQGLLKDIPAFGTPETIYADVQRHLPRAG
jgi:adenylate kinase